MPQYSIFFHLKKAALDKQLPGIFFQERMLSIIRQESKVLLWLVKILTLLLMAFFIREKVVNGQLSFEEIVVLGRTLWGQEQGALLLIPVLLMPLNWGLEAKKWQLLARPVITLSLDQAVRAVLTGLSLGFITPRSVGDYAGRILEVPRGKNPRVDTPGEGNQGASTPGASTPEASTPGASTQGVKKEGLVGAVLLNRLSQSLVTNLVGLGGLLFLFLSNPPEDKRWWGWLSLFVVAGILAGLFLLSKGRKALVKGAEKNAFLQPLFRFIRIMEDYSSKEMNLLLAYAFFRYCVFSFQFVLILWLAGVSLPVQALVSGVAVVFMLKSVIPAFHFLSDLGVREFSALLVFSVYDVPENQLIAASVLLWCLNILFPTIVGGANILRLRLNPSSC